MKNTSHALNKHSNTHEKHCTRLKQTLQTHIKNTTHAWNKTLQTHKQTNTQTSKQTNKHCKHTYKRFLVSHRPARTQQMSYDPCCWTNYFATIPVVSDIEFIFSASLAAPWNETSRETTTEQEQNDNCGDGLHEPNQHGMKELWDQTKSEMSGARCHLVRVLEHQQNDL